MFPTSEKIYNRIRTDGHLYPNKAMVTYYDSIMQKYMDCPLLKWIPIKNGGDIPWHRVYFIKYDNDIIWDRENKICTIDEVAQRVNEIKCLDKMIKIITLNVMSDVFEKKITDIKKRKEKLIEYIFASNANICCLQEVSLELLNAIVEYNQNNGKKYDIVNTQIGENDLCILTTATIIGSSTVKLNPMKEIIIATVNDVNNEQLKIFNVHLTSDSSSCSKIKRDVQFQILNKQLESLDKYILLGDFNQDTYNFEIINNPNDVAIVMNKIEATYDPATNKYAKLLSVYKSEKRLDRILFQHRNLIPISIDVDRIVISDHYPLICQFDTRLLTQDYDSTFISIDNNKVDSQNKLSLCAIIPYEYWSEINKIRAKYDVVYEKWMPHISIIKTSKLNNKNVDQLAKYLPLHLHIIGFNFWKQSKLYTLYLELDSGSIHKLRQIYDDIRIIDPAISEEFNPHITLGNFDNIEDVERFTKRQIPACLTDICVNKLQLVAKSEEIYNTVHHIINNEEIHVNILDITMHMLNIIRQIFSNCDIKIGGSAIYSMEDCHDVDLVAIGTQNRDDFFKNGIKLLSQCGEFIKVQRLTNDYTDFIKLESSIKCFDIHYYDQNFSDDIRSTNALSVYTASKKIYDLMEENNKKNEFLTNLQSIKTLCKQAGVYGQQYGYLSGLGIAMMVGIVTLNIKSNENFVNKFCQYWKTYDYSKIICIIPTPIIHRDSFRHMILLCPVEPYNQICRSMTKSTFVRIIQCFEREFVLDDHLIPTKLIIRSDDETLVIKFINWFNVSFLKLILYFEKLNMYVVPSNDWISENSSIYANSMIFTFYYTENLSKHYLLQHLMEKAYQIFTQLEITIV